jgi:hypothetical protein
MTTSHFGELLDLHGLGEDRNEIAPSALCTFIIPRRDGTLGWHKARIPRNCFSAGRGRDGRVYRSRYAG